MIYYAANFTCNGDTVLLNGGKWTSAYDPFMGHKVRTKVLNVHKLTSFCDSDHYKNRAVEIAIENRRYIKQTIEDSDIQQVVDFIRGK